MKRILALLAVFFLAGNDAWAQDQISTDQNNGLKTVFRHDWTPSISVMQPIAQENEFSVMLVSANISLFKLQDQLYGEPFGNPLRFLTVGLGGGIRKAGGLDSNERRASLGDLLLVIYPITLPLAIHDDYDSNPWELHFSPGIMRNLTSRSWGFVSGFSFVFPHPNN